MKLSIVFLLLFIVNSSLAQKVAITFDDLPLNGTLPPGISRVQIAQGAIALLKARNLPATYGFINAKKLEGNTDAGEALKVWAAAEPVGNHTYSHLNLDAITAEEFAREIDKNEPALELLAGKDSDWH